jgi:peptide/nickel transport system substrate-binding protein
MAMAIDHQGLIVAARRGQATLLCTDHSAALVPGYQPDAPCPRFDVQAANALLEQHGWIKGSDGVRVKGGARLEFQYSTTSDNEWRNADELLVQQDFQAIGIKLDIQNYPASTFISRLLDGEYELAAGEQHGVIGQLPPNGFNLVFYCNHLLDTLFLQEQQTVDPTGRQQTTWSGCGGVTGDSVRQRAVLVLLPVITQWLVGQ